MTTGFHGGDLRRGCNRRGGVAVRGVEMISVTQESIARVLGIRRTTVTLIAQQFQARGVISYRRGKIGIHDRDALHAVACDCYRALGRANWPSELLATAGACCQSYHPAAG